MNSGELGTFGEEGEPTSRSDEWLIYIKTNQTNWILEFNYYLIALDLDLIHCMDSVYTRTHRI